MAMTSGETVVTESLENRQFRILFVCLGNKSSYILAVPWIS